MVSFFNWKTERSLRASECTEFSPQPLNQMIVGETLFIVLNLEQCNALNLRAVMTSANLVLHAQLSFRSESARCSLFFPQRQMWVRKVVSIPNYHITHLILPETHTSFALCSGWQKIIQKNNCKSDLVKKCDWLSLDKSINKWCFMDLSSQIQIMAEAPVCVGH